jgi:hypothetical protein
MASANRRQWAMPRWHQRVRPTLRRVRSAASKTLHSGKQQNRESHHGTRLGARAGQVGYDLGFAGLVLGLCLLHSGRQPSRESPPGTRLGARAGQVGYDLGFAGLVLGLCLLHCGRQPSQESPPGTRPEARAGQLGCDSGFLKGGRPSL